MPAPLLKAGQHFPLFFGGFFNHDFGAAGGAFFVYGFVPGRKLAPRKLIAAEKYFPAL